MRSGKKIGIMGGTFNPIHNGHLQLAMAAQDQVSLDQILFMPSGNSYMKRNVLETQKRVDMVALAIARYPNFELSLIEAQKSGNTYTCETLKYLTASNPDVQYYFIIGADILFQIEQWRNPEQIYQLAVLVCAVRDDYDFDAIQKKGNLLKASGADIVYLNMPKSDISSTDIRAKVKSSLSISKLVPSEVAHYIEQEHLYYEED